MSSPTTVRFASLADLDALAPLFNSYRQFYRQADDLGVAREFLAARLGASESTVLLAENEAGEALGFIQLYPTFCSLAAQPFFILSDLFVAESARRGGVGRTLMTSAAAFAAEQGAVRMELNTQLTNTKAQALYESLGWQKNTEFFFYDLPTAA